LRKLKPWEKEIPHHLNKGPCKNCLVRAVCNSHKDGKDCCEDLLSFYYNCSNMEKYQILNYLHNKEELHFR